LLGASPVLALDSHSPTSSYLRTTFTTEDGLPTNIINAVVQSSDGFLWIGTSNGLTRFDGRHFDQVNLGRAVSVNMMALTPNDDLWLATPDGALRLSLHGLYQADAPHVTVYHLGADNPVWRILLARDGTVWAGTSKGLYRYDGGAGFSEIVGGLPVYRIDETPDGHVLVPTSKGFLELEGTRTVDHSEIASELGLSADWVFQVFQDREGILWFSTGRGLFRRVGKVTTHFRGKDIGGIAFETYEDRQGNKWVSTNTGVFRVRDNSLEPLAQNTQCRALYADRDGGLWIGTNGSGLMHFKDRAVHMFTRADGLRSDVIMAVLTTHSGKLWVGTDYGGVSWFDGKRFHSFPDKEHLLDCAYALAEDRSNNIWVGTYGGGLFRLHDQQFTQYTKAQGLPDKNNVVLGLLSASDGSLWIATPRALTHFLDGTWRTYSSDDGLPDADIKQLSQDHDGTIWVANTKGLYRRIGDRFFPIVSEPGAGLVGEDMDGHLYTSIKFRVSPLNGNAGELVPGLRAWTMIEPSRNELWFAADDGIYRTTTQALNRWESKREDPLDYAKFARADGMRSAECTNKASKQMAVTPDGRLWVATEQGLAMIEPEHLPRSSEKPLVYIRETVVGRTNRRGGNELVLPPGTSHVELDFAPVEISSPERVRLQYRLDDVDDGWLDAPASHVATYSGIPLGAHTFHVRATDRDGVWDREGLVYQVIQQPFVYQTAWFRVLSAAVFVALLLVLHRYRMRQVAHEFDVRLEERLNERTRIAQELHDTLLQSFQGLLFHLHVVSNVLPKLPTEEAKDRLNHIIEQAQQAVNEGRDAVQGLRSSTVLNGDLSVALGALGEELAAGTTQSRPAFHLVVEGKERTLKPLLRDEILRIASEAFRNAFRHAQANRIDVFIHYDERQLALHVRDDGKGIRQERVDEKGSPGHWGLQGMRERAQRIGGKLELWSRPGAGTEVQLQIPGEKAYESPGRAKWFSFWRSSNVDIQHDSR
jgi:signal transduction histidine kinase/ligand-binding sensor domain-containing protein